MKDRTPENFVLKGQIERLMIEALKSYPQHQFISELFARYFELLSISREVKVDSGFSTKQIMEFFANTSKWIEKIFNPKIKTKINPQIAAYSQNLIEQNSFKSERKFADSSRSFYKHSSSNNVKSFANNISSNANWQKSWQKHQELEDKK